MKGGERNPRAAQGQGQEEPSRGLSDTWGTSQKAAKGCTEPEISPPTGPRLFGGCGSASDSSPVSDISVWAFVFWFLAVPGAVVTLASSDKTGETCSLWRRTEPCPALPRRAGPAVPHLLGLRHTAGKETAGGTNSGAQKLCEKGERKRGRGLAPVEMVSPLPYSTGEESTRHRRETGTTSLLVQPPPQAGGQPPDPTAPYIAQLRVRRGGRGVMP